MGYSAIRSKGETQDVKGRDVSGICLTSKTGDLLVCRICGRKGHTIMKTACGKEIIPYVCDQFIIVST